LGLFDCLGYGLGLEPFKKGVKKLCHRLANLKYILLLNTKLHQMTIKLLPAIAFMIFSCYTASAQTADEKAIRAILTEQTESWNKGDLEDFMKGYWKSDSLMFIGKNGITYGYDNTLANYKKGYSNKEQMGTLKFDLLLVKRLSAEYYYVIGKWTLTRTVGNLGGHYDLLFRKINGKWVIIADHSS
jgi:ketosteroid isomerase-like protein